MESCSGFTKIRKLFGKVKKYSKTQCRRKQEKRKERIGELHNTNKEPKQFNLKSFVKYFVAESIKPEQPIFVSS